MNWWIYLGITSFAIVTVGGRPPHHMRPAPPPTMPSPPNMRPRPSTPSVATAHTLATTAATQPTSDQGSEERVNQGLDVHLFGGDIVLTPEQQATLEATSNQNDPFSPQNAVVRDQQFLWRNGLVYYVLDNSLSEDAENAIRSAMDAYTMQTCIRFQLRQNEEDYVRFFTGNGCFSYIGRISGQQDISIGRGCEYPGIIMHEVFHALGRWHEQSRPDRDLFVRINQDNIQSGVESNFEKVSSAFATTQSVPYDYRSIMHYSAYAFSRNGNPTIEPINSSVSQRDLGQRSGLSSYDLQHVNALYCGESVASSWSEWGPWSSCSRTCNGGTRVRQRTCTNGFTCAGSNIDTEQCNTDQCSVEASWGSWGSWSGCSASCGGGRRSRARSCENGNTCTGRMTQFEDCNNNSCPESAVWGTWGSWSECSQTCQGGTRFRRRTCQNGNLCEGSNIIVEYCNSEVTCIDQPNHNTTDEWSEWSECTASCGGGTRFRTRQCRNLTSDCEVDRENCSTQDCNPEPRLRGIQPVGCYLITRRSKSLFFLEGTTTDLSDSAQYREQPIRKCGEAAQSNGFSVFAVSLGYCISGSNRVQDYQYFRSSFCQGGVGGYYAGWFLMDVYQITNTEMFADSVYLILNPNTTNNATTMPGMLPTASTFHVTVSVTPTASYPRWSSMFPSATVPTLSLLPSYPPWSSMVPSATVPTLSLLPSYPPWSSMVPSATVPTLSLLPSYSPWSSMVPSATIPTLSLLPSYPPWSSMVPSATVPTLSLLPSYPPWSSMVPSATIPTLSLLPSYPPWSSMVPSATVPTLSLLPSVSPTVSSTSGAYLMASFWTLVISVHTAAYFLASAWM